jgi:phage gp37-like protein
MTSGVGGGDMLPLAQIEQAIKDAIHALNRPYLKEIKTYAGDFDFNDDREFAQVVKRFPAVWTTFDGSGKPEKLGARKYKIPLTFSVIVGARSIRSEESSRHGTTVGGEVVDVGTFGLVNDVLAAVLAQNFGIEAIRPFELGQLRTIFNTKTQSEAVSVLAQSFTTDCTICVRTDEDNTAEYIEKVNIDYIHADRVIAGDLVEVQHG